MRKPTETALRTHSYAYSKLDRALAEQIKGVSYENAEQELCQRQLVTQMESFLPKIEDHSYQSKAKTVWLQAISEDVDEDDQQQKMVLQAESDYRKNLFNDDSLRKSTIVVDDGFSESKTTMNSSIITFGNKMSNTKTGLNNFDSQQASMFTGRNSEAPDPLLQSN